MSYATYLRNKMDSQPKIMALRKPEDASQNTHKKRLEATQVFFASGQGVGTLIRDTTRSDGTPLLSHPAVSFSKSSTRPADASTYTSYRGHAGVGDDSKFRNGGKQVITEGCVPIPEVDGSKYKTAGDVTRDKLACDTSNALLDPPRFVDNTIRLSAMHTEMVAAGGCCTDSLTKAIHDHSPGLPICNQRQDFAVTQHTFMAAPPEFQNPGVGGARIGAYYTPKSGYVENKHGNDLNVNPRRVPTMWRFSKGAPAHLKINDPTFANVKP